MHDIKSDILNNPLLDLFASILFVLFLRHLLAFDFLLFVASLCLKSPVLSKLQIYYLTRGRQFVSAYALSMLSVAKIHILIRKLISHIVLVHLFLKLV